MPDRLATTVEAFERLTSPMEWSDVLERAATGGADGADHGLPPAAGPRSARRRRPALVAAALVLVVGAVALAWPGDEPTPSSVTTDPGPGPIEVPTTTGLAPTATTLPGTGTHRGMAVGVWTGTEYLVWGGEAGGDGSGRADGWRYDPATGTARDVPVAPIAPRDTAAGVWTGTELIVCCGRPQGQGPSYDTASAAAFDPGTDRWRRLADPPAEAGSYSLGGFWTGSEVLVVVASDEVSTAGAHRGMALYAYDPESDRWSDRSGPTIGTRMDEAIWTGERLVLWSSARSPGDRGIVYDPGTDRWSDLPALPGDRPVVDGSIAYADGQVVVWGHDGSDGARSVGYRLRLGEGAWRSMAPAPLPAIVEYEGTDGSQALATDPAASIVVVAPVTGYESGSGGAGTPPPSLYTYDPGTDRWSTIGSFSMAFYAPDLVVGGGTVFLPDRADPEAGTLTG
jgi:hypothetical protein